MLDEHISSSANADHISAGRCYSSTDLGREVPTIANRQEIIISPSAVIMDFQGSWLIEVPLGNLGCSPWVRVPDKPSLSPSPVPMSAHLRCHILQDNTVCAVSGRYISDVCVHARVYIYICIPVYICSCMCVYIYIFPANQTEWLLCQQQGPFASPQHQCFCSMLVNIFINN